MSPAERSFQVRPLINYIYSHYTESVHYEQSPIHLEQHPPLWPSLLDPSLVSCWEGAMFPLLFPTPALLCFLPLRRPYD